MLKVTSSERHPWLIIDRTISLQFITFNRLLFYKRLKPGMIIHVECAKHACVPGIEGDDIQQILVLLAENREQQKNELELLEAMHTNVEAKGKFKRLWN